MKEAIVRLTSDHIKVKGGEYVQDVVRCKECKHIYTYNCPLYESGYDVRSTDFCSYGVKKGADE